MNLNLPSIVIMISNFERILSVFGETTESSITEIFNKLTIEYGWVDNHTEAERLMSRFRGILISSICGELEQELKLSFRKIISKLPNTPTTKADSYWHQNMPINSTLKGRAKSMWAIRIAFTHGNGLISQIKDSDLVDHLTSSRHLCGVHLEEEQIILGGDITFPVIRSATDIYERHK